MIPLSSSRIYLFGVKYKNNTHVDDFSDELVNAIKVTLDNHFSEFGYKDITVVNSFKNGNIASEIHINKLFYKNKRIFNINTGDEIRLKLESCLRFIKDFSYTQLQIINDDFDRIPSSGLVSKKMEGAL
jgi:hypothetical protein